MTSLSIKQKAQQYVVLTGMALFIGLLVGAIDMIFGQGSSPDRGFPKPALAFDSFSGLSGACHRLSL